MKKGVEMKSYFVASVVIAMSFAAMAYETNTWQGQSGGKWSEPKNWSLERVPSANDYTVFPDVGSSYTIEVDGGYEIHTFYMDEGKNTINNGTLTLVGTGSILSSGKNENYVRAKRALILNGVSLKLTGNYLMTYGPITVKNGAVFETVNKNLSLWKTAPALHVEDGGTVIVDGSIQNHSEAIVNVNGGNVTAKRVCHYAGATRGMKISVTEGSFTADHVAITNGSSIAVSGGTLKVTGSIDTVNWDKVGLDLTGGTVVLPKPNFPQRIVSENKGSIIEYVTGYITVEQVTDKAVLENLNGGGLVVTLERNDAINVFTADGQSVVVGGRLDVPNGYISISGKNFIYSDYPVQTRGFCNNSTGSYPTLHFSEIIFDRYNPFASPKESGEARTFLLEGPTTIRAIADMTKSTGRSVYPMLSGDFVVDTRDYNDPSVKRKMAFRGLGAKDAATLTIRGGGELWLMQTHSGSPFSRVTVEEGTTLTLATLGLTVDYGPFHTEELVLGPNSVLNIPAGSNSVHAASWTVDPTATINILIPEGLEPSARGLMYDLSGVYKVPENQIRLVGDTDAALAGWGLVSSEGAWALTNANADVTADAQYEWTGAGSDNLSQNPDNWTGDGKPIEKVTYKFGAATGNYTTANFHRFYHYETNDTAKGATVGGVQFRNTAVNTFTVYGGGGITYANSGEYSGAAIVSYSSVPQKFTGAGIRANSPTLYAAKEAPLIFSFSSDFQKRSATGLLRFLGDIRFADTSVSFPQMKFDQIVNGYGHVCIGARLTVLPGANMVFTNQMTSFATSYTGFSIREGGTVTFNNGSGDAFFQWENCGMSAKNTIDGTLNLNVPLRGGSDQAYGGKGVMNIHSVVPHSKASRVSFGENLTVNLPTEWQTVSSANPSVPLGMKIYGTPKFHADGGWTYGPAEGVESEVESVWRSMQICKGATLTFDPNGGDVVLNDPLSGSGTFAITNGTLLVPGGVVNTPGIEVRAGGCFEWDEPLSLCSVKCVSDGVMRMKGLAALTVKELVDFTKVNLEWVKDPSCVKDRTWRSLFISKTGFTGELTALAGAYYTRIVETANGYEYQIRSKIGTVVTFR